jgi:hypothetical protein
LHKRVLGLATGLVAVFSIAACSEKLEGGGACPLLCPQQAVTLKDTTIDALVVDTTVNGLPSIGTEAYLMLASHGDTLDSRAIVRFDTLPGTYSKNGVDSTITRLDTAQLIVPIAFDSTKRPTVPITIELYNVDTTDTASTVVNANLDTSVAVLAPLFRPNRLIGGKTFAPESLSDTLRIPISTDTVVAAVKNGKHLRVGFKIVSSKSADIRIATALAGTPVRLRMKPSLDTSVAAVFVSPLSLTPTNQTFLSQPLADYTIVVKGGSTTAATLLGVGGVPSRRVYLKFNVPSHIVDSTSIVRASLLLTQTPNRLLNPRDSIYVFPVPILATSAVSNYASALQFLGGIGQFGLDSLKLAPADSGVRSFEIVGLVRTWRQQPENISPRTLALRSGTEGQLGAEIDFFSTRAALAVRPRLRITYVPVTSTGLP